MFKKVIYNTGAQVLGKGITASITLLVTFLIARSMGASGYGEFTKIIVFVAYFYTLADFGLNSIYIKIAKENETQNLRVLLGIRILVGLTLAIMATSVAFLLPYNPQTGTGFSPLVKVGIALASITILTQALFTTANAFYQKILRYDLSMVSAVTSYLFVLTIAAIVTLTTKSLLGYVSAYTIGGLVLASTALLVIARRTKVSLFPIFSKSQALSFIKPAWPVGLALIFNLIYFRIDVFILSNFRSSQEVGLYGLAYQFFEAALALPIFFSNAIYPLLATLFKENVNEFKKEAKRWFFILLLVSVALSTSIFAVSFVIPSIFGKSFAGSVPALQILAVGFPFFFISALLWHIIIIFDKQKYLTLIYASGAVFNLFANLYFIPKSGYIAASVITVISEALIALMLGLVVWRLRNA